MVKNCIMLRLGIFYLMNVIMSQFFSCVFDVGWEKLWKLLHAHTDTYTHVVYI